MERGRRIAFDYGDARTGIATSDADSIVVTPLPALPTTSASFMSDIAGIFLDYEPVTIFVGEPRHLSGAESAKMLSVADFVSALKELTAAEIVMIDERLSTVSAAAKLRANGKDAKSSKSLIDSAAAAEILEAGLNKMRLQNP
jgi:putative Holliday junction resolvase